MEAVTHAVSIVTTRVRRPNKVHHKRKSTSGQCDQSAADNTGGRNVVNTKVIDG